MTHPMETKQEAIWKKKIIRRKVNPIFWKKWSQEKSKKLDCHKRTRII